MTRERAFAWIARFGYAARGAVFLLVGIFAGFAAAAAYQRPLDSKDVLRTVFAQDAGGVLLGVIAAGLLSFAMWRLAQGLLDADACGREPRALLQRALHAAAGIFYLGFASVAFSIMLGREGRGNSDQTAHDWTAWLLGKPFGGWLIAGVGAAFIISAGAIAIAGCRGALERRLELKQPQREAVGMIGRLGFIARAVVLLMIGLFLVFAAVNANSREAKGVAGALRVIQQQPLGALWLAITAAGLIAFGVFSFSEAAYRRIDAPRLRAAS